MDNISRQFDLGTAALEHLELLNQSNQNPLIVAAQFRTLLKSKKTNENHFITTNTINSNKECSQINNQFSYPTINWKYLRRKQYEYKLEQFISLKFKTKDLIHSNKIKSYSRIRSPSPSIRTPCISPINYLQQPTYTISKLNSTSMNNDDIFFPIADCNLIIKHKSL